MVALSPNWDSTLLWARHNAPLRPGLHDMRVSGVTSLPSGHAPAGNRLTSFNQPGATFIYYRSVSP